MNDETTSIANILTDWTTKPELIAGAAQLGLSAWTSALAPANEAFRAKYLQRTNEMAAAATPDNIKALRLEGNKAWYDLMDMIIANYTLAKGADAWGVVVPQLNTLIDQYNATLAARAGRADVVKGGDSAPAAGTEA